MDPVAQRLASVGDDQAAGVLDWLDGQHLRDNMNRRAFWCSLTGWLLVTVAAIVGWWVSSTLTSDVQEVFGGRYAWRDRGLSVPWSVRAVPIALGIASVALLIGGVIGWRLDMIPGLRSTRSAIDWSGISDAMSRLLAVGCTYPEAFRATAAVSRTQSARDWLLHSANRIEQGGADIRPSSYAVGDTATLELLVEPSKTQPDRQWRFAADHFADTATRRLVLLLGSVPMLSTIVSGFLVWMSISASLGWMWRAAAELIRGFTT